MQVRMKKMKITNNRSTRGFVLMGNHIKVLKVQMGIEHSVSNVLYTDQAEALQP